MAPLKVAQPLLGLLLIVQAEAAAPARSETSWDGRFHGKCSNWANHLLPAERCFVSFYRLIANPEQYDGRVVSVVGYIVNDEDGLHLVPSREHFDNRFFGEEIRLAPAANLVGKILRLKGKTRAFAMTGIFDAKVQATPWEGGLIRVVAFDEARGGASRAPPPFVPAPRLSK